MHDDCLRLLLEIGQYNGVQKIGGDQNNHFGSIPRPYRALPSGELAEVLKRISRATLVERRKLVVFRTFASMGVGYVLFTAADHVPRQIQPSEAWLWLGLMLFTIVVAWAVCFRLNPLGENVEDWIGTVAELRLQRRVVLAEIALRRVEGRWPSHTEEARAFLFGPRRGQAE